jgi:catechol 2,3-dioxygenase-like lactoylglutathione lyase family enzyme
VPEILRSNPVLAVHDLDRSGAWYEAVLGCTLDAVDPGNWLFATAPGGGTTFMLGRCPDAAPASEIGDHSYVAYLHVDDVDAFHAQAVTHGAEVLKPPTDEPWKMRELALRTPDGHRLMLGQAIAHATT